MNVFNQLQPMTDDMLRRAAPSIFATEKHISRSQRYAYIPTFEIVTAMRNEGFAPVLAKQSRTRIEGKAPFTKHMIRFQRLDAPSVRSLGDVVASLCLVNSHDGTSAYQLMSALDRLVCLNGLTIKLAEMDDVRIHHSGDVVGKVIEGSYRVIETSAKVTERALEWNGINLTDGEIGAFARSAARLRFDSESAVNPMQLVAPRRQADVAPTLWNVFNRAQEALLKGGQRHYSATGRRQTVRPVNSIDKDVGLNQALWTLGEEMAKLKAGVASAVMGATV